MGRIHNATHAEMKAHAFNKSNGGQKEIYFCIIDGSDTDRILKAYNKLNS